MPVQPGSTGRSAPGPSSRASTTAETQPPAALRARRVGGAQGRRCRWRSIDDPALRDAIGEHAHQQLLDEIALLDGAGTGFDAAALPRRRADAGVLRQRADQLRRRAVPRPLPRAGAAAAPRATAAGVDRARRAVLLRLRLQDPGEHGPAAPRPRRLRARLLGPLRARHGGRSTCAPASRSALNSSLQFLAQERTLIDEAFAGDIVGLWDPGVLRIGDTLVGGPGGRVRRHPALLARALRARAC